MEESFFNEDALKGKVSTTGGRPVDSCLFKGRDAGELLYINRVPKG